MDSLNLAYLAGAIDSDGYITIKKSTYRRRVVGDSFNATYSETVGLHQVTPQIPELLRSTFGGTNYHAKSQAPNRRPMFCWEISDAQAAHACKLLTPFLRVKKRQAELALELRSSKSRPYSSPGYWFALEFPDWASMELVTTSEAAKILGYTSREAVSQAVRNQTLLSLPYDQRGTEVPRIPLALVERVHEQRKFSRDGRGRVKPPELIAWRERLRREIKELNRMGVDGTPIYHGTGPYTPIQ